MGQTLFKSKEFNRFYETTIIYVKQKSDSNFLMRLHSCSVPVFPQRIEIPFFVVLSLKTTEFNIIFFN